jgi:hypothetical protein
MVGFPSVGSALQPVSAMTAAAQEPLADEWRAPVTVRDRSPGPILRDSCVARTLRRGRHQEILRTGRLRCRAHAQQGFNEAGKRYSRASCLSASGHGQDGLVLPSPCARGADAGIAVFHASLMGQTFGTRKGLFSRDFFSVPKITLCWTDSDACG